LEVFANFPHPIQVETQPLPPTTPPHWPMMEQAQLSPVDTAAAASAVAVDASTNAADQESSQRGYGSEGSHSSKVIDGYVSCWVICS
jgi:hypothetical protein